MVLELHEAQHQQHISNPLLDYKRLIPFDLIEPDHFLPAFNAMEEELLPQIEILEEIENPTWESVVVPLEEIEEKIHRVVGPMAHLKLVKDSPALPPSFKTSANLSGKVSSFLLTPSLTLKARQRLNTLSPVRTNTSKERSQPVTSFRASTILVGENGRGEIERNLQLTKQSAITP